MLENEEAPKKSSLWLIKNGAAAPRLVRASRRGQVESYLLQDFEILRAKPEDVLVVTQAGGAVEEVA